VRPHRRSAHGIIECNLRKALLQLLLREAAGLTFSLTFLNRFDIKDKDEDLKEPSGLTLDGTGDGLWTVSDDTARVFRLGLDGTLDKERSFDVTETCLEGITIDPSGRFLFTVREESNEVFKLDIAGQEVADQRRLKDMDGYKTIRDFFKGKIKNKNKKRKRTRASRASPGTPTATRSLS